MQYRRFHPTGLRSPSQPKNVTVLWPIPSHTAWWQRHIGVNNLPKVVTQLCSGGNWTNELLIASPTPYRYATMPPQNVEVPKKYRPLASKLAGDRRCFIPHRHHPLPQLFHRTYECDDSWPTIWKILDTRLNKRTLKMQFYQQLAKQKTAFTSHVLRQSTVTHVLVMWQESGNIVEEEFG